MDNWIHLPLEKLEVMQALQKALASNFIDNLRQRHPNVALDSKLRGYVGEIAFKKWLLSQGIEDIESNIMDLRSSMDIDFLVRYKKQSRSLELKTSLIPDADQVFERVAEKRDIKLIRRNTEAIENLKGEIHVQLFYRQLRIRKDEWLKKQKINFEATIEQLYDKIAAFRYENDAYLAAWIDKKSLIKQLHAKPKHLQKWKYGKREFWCCNLNKDAKQPKRLIAFLKAEDT